MSAHQKPSWAAASRALWLVRMGGRGASQSATQNTTPQASASGSAEPHKTTEPAATIQVVAGSSKRAPVTKTGQVAGTETEQTRFHSGNRRVASGCDAECDAISADRVEVLARAVVLVAGMNIPEAAREAVLARVVAELTSQTTRILE